MYLGISLTLLPLLLWGLFQKASMTGGVAVEA